jgi:2-polyprenyl-3-methyl-5-hydroxy-6-metoxy-1,4-benzoquinol methylase
MKALAALYRQLDKFYSVRHFELSYRIDPDPWDVANNLYKRHKADVLLEVVAKRRHKNAIDIGCGPGILTQRLAAHCDHILGIDFSPKAISLAEARSKDNPRIAFAVGDIRNFNHSAKYDLLICSEVLDYMYLQDPQGLENTLEKLAELAAPDAWLVVVGSVKDRTLPKLERRFKLMDRVEEKGWHRPFAVSVFGV